MRRIIQHFCQWRAATEDLTEALDTGAARTIALADLTAVQLLGFLLALF